MKIAKFLVSHFDAGVEKFKAGQAYPLNDETSLCIARGAAEEVDVPDEPAATEQPSAEAGEAAGAEAAAAEVVADAPPAAPVPTGKGKK